MAQFTYYAIHVGGNDISRSIAPFLLNLRVTLHTEKTSDEATLELDDAGAKIHFPEKDASVEIFLGNAEGMAVVFRGSVDDVNFKYSRGGGSVVTVTAKSAETNGKGKSQREQHWEDKTLGEVLKDAGKKAGISVEVDQELASIKRAWWGMTAESFYHFGQRLSREVGGSFKVVGKKAVLAKLNSGKSPTGGAISTVRAIKGENLLTVDVSPVLGRPRFESVQARWYDRKEAKWKQEKVQVEKTDSKAGAIVRHTKPGKDTAKKAADNDKETSKREQGEGTVTIDGNPSATPGGTCILACGRPGVDGSYRIDSVTHSLDRGSGYTTDLTLKQPDDETGKDSRKAT